MSLVSAPTLTTATPIPASPAALRARRPGWRDPRLAMGVGLVAVCALLGARLLGSADDTIPVWSLRGAGIAGQAIGPGDLAVSQVRFGSGGDADRYVLAEPLPDGAVLVRDVAAGELLPRSALGGVGDVELVELPITVSVTAAPATLSVGTVVDVWVTRRDADEAVPALQAVPVLALPGGQSSLGASADRQVVVGLDAVQQRRLPQALALLADGMVVLTSRFG